MTDTQIRPDPANPDYRARLSAMLANAALAMLVDPVYHDEDTRPPGQAFRSGSDEQAMFDLGAVAGLESELSGRVVPEQAPGPRFDAIYRAGINQGRHLAGILRRNTERWSPDALAEYAKSTERAETAITEAGAKLANNMNGASKLVRDAFDRGYRQATADRAAGYSPPTGPETASIYLNLAVGDVFVIDTERRYVVGAWWEDDEGLHIHGGTASSGVENSDFPVINPPAPGVEVPVKTGGPDYRARATQDDLDRAFGDHPAEPPRPPIITGAGSIAEHMRLSNTVLTLCAPAMLLAEGDTPALSYYPERRSYGLQLKDQDGYYHAVKPQDLKAGRAIVYPSQIGSTVQAVFRSLRNAGYPVRSNEEPALPLEDGAVDQVPAGDEAKVDTVTGTDVEYIVTGSETAVVGMPSTRTVTDSQPTVAGMPADTNWHNEDGTAADVDKPDPVAKAKEDLTKATAARRPTPKKPPAGGGRFA